jgi:VanZ family protein
MDRLIQWFSEHRIVTVIAAGVYYLAVVLLHEEVSKVSVWLSMSLSLRLYDKAISAFGVVVAVALSPLAVTRLRRGDRPGSTVFYWGLTALLVAASYNVLFVVNAESIHFPQYALLAVPVFALTRSFGVTILTITLLGAVDEGYQFFVLKNWTYFDFNDIITNLVGGAIGILLVFTFSMQRAADSRPLGRLLRSPILLATVGLVAAAVLLYLLGLLALYPGPNADRAWIVLSKVPPSDTFWIRMKWGRTYHILTPMEGLALWALLSGCYAFMDWRTRAVSTLTSRA